jgi:transcriptional regulator with XRE-family HTH domain
MSPTYLPPRHRSFDVVACGRSGSANWLDAELPDLAQQREFAQERCILALTESVLAAMDSAGLSRSALADRIGVGKSHVSQLLNGSRNMTLRTLGDLYWACGLEVRGIRTTLIGSEAQTLATIPYSATDPSVTAFIAGAVSVAPLKAKTGNAVGTNLNVNEALAA